MDNVNSGTSKAALGDTYIQKNSNFLLQLIVHVKITLLDVHTPLQATYYLPCLGISLGFIFAKSGRKSSNALI